MSITEGPISECYDNGRQTIFRYITGIFLQGLVDDTYQMFSAQLPGQSQTILFRPTPDAGQCVRRQLKLVPTVGEQIVRTNSIQFSPMSVDGPPEVEIPLDEDTLQYRFVGDMNEEGDETLVVGVQFLVGGSVKHGQRFRRPLKLAGMEQMDHDVSRISVMMLQVIGVPANDGKQQNILLGDISNSGICACPSCRCMRVDFGKWSRRLLKHCEKKGCGRSCQKEKL